jgi:hypothetical protein
LHLKLPSQIQDMLLNCSLISKLLPNLSFSINIYPL